MWGMLSRNRACDVLACDVLYEIAIGGIMKKTMSAILTYIFLAVSSPVHAQLDPNDSTRPRLNEGSLFAVRVVPGNGRLHSV